MGLFTQDPTTKAKESEFLVLSPVLSLEISMEGTFPFPTSIWEPSEEVANSTEFDFPANPP